MVRRLAKCGPSARAGATASMISLADARDCIDAKFVVLIPIDAQSRIFTMKYRIQNSEVLHTDSQVTSTDSADINLLKQMSKRNPRHRIRLCAHDGVGDRLHEMLIVHGCETYVRPHKHPEKSESTHVIEGLVDLVLFDEDGNPKRVVRMGDYDSGRIFYFRMATPVFHTLIVRSEVLVFHETTNGPFDREATVFAPWSPEDGNFAAVSEYIAGLEKAICLTESTSKEKS